MPKSRQVDVLVVGLGPAGASAARVAAEFGCEVLAIDRKERAGFPVQCAEFVPSMLTPSVSAASTAACQRITEMHTFVEHYDSDRTKNFGGVMLDREKFDSLLVSAASTAGASCHFDLSITRIGQDSNVILSNGQHLNPRVIIGADGPRSTIGRTIGSTNKHLVISRQITVPLIQNHDATDIFLSNHYPGGYAWMFPRGEVANVGLGVSPDAKKNLKRELARLHERLVSENRVGNKILARTGGAIPVGGMINPIGDVGGIHIYLAGDAAGLTNPITGAGINAAVLSGEAAGESAQRWLAGQDGDVEYLEELESLFGNSLRHAVRKRTALQSYYADGDSASEHELRETWIAFPQYWSQYQDPKTINYSNRNTNKLALNQRARI